MRVGDILYFAPNRPFSSLDFTDSANIAQAFSERVVGYYLNPAARLVETRDGFAAGLVICAAIEFIALAIHEQPAKWLSDNVGALTSALANKFWINFRHGLTHEGRVKSPGQFSFEQEELILETGNVLIVNPEVLLEAIRTAFNGLIQSATAETKTLIATRLKRYFEPEVRAAR